jgi:hypothetical protein
MLLETVFDQGYTQYTNIGDRFDIIFRGSPQFDGVLKSEFSADPEHWRPQVLGFLNYNVGADTEVLHRGFDHTILTEKGEIFKILQKSPSQPLEAKML